MRSSRAYSHRVHISKWVLVILFLLLLYPFYTRGEVSQDHYQDQGDAVPVISPSDGSQKLADRVPNIKTQNLVFITHY